MNTVSEDEFIKKSILDCRNMPVQYAGLYLKRQFDMIKDESYILDEITRKKRILDKSLKLSRHNPAKYSFDLANFVYYDDKPELEEKKSFSLPNLDDSIDKDSYHPDIKKKIQTEEEQQNINKPPPPSEQPPSSAEILKYNNEPTKYFEEKSMDIFNIKKDLYSDKDFSSGSQTTLSKTVELKTKVEEFVKQKETVFESLKAQKAIEINPSNSTYEILDTAFNRLLEFALHYPMDPVTPEEKSKLYTVAKEQLGIAKGVSMELGKMEEKLKQQEALDSVFEKKVVYKFEELFKKKIKDINDYKALSYSTPRELYDTLEDLTTSLVDEYSSDKLIQSFYDKLENFYTYDNKYFKKKINEIVNPEFKSTENYIKYDEFNTNIKKLQEEVNELKKNKLKYKEYNNMKNKLKNLEEEKLMMKETYLKDVESLVYLTKKSKDEAINEIFGSEIGGLKFETPSKYLTKVYDKDNKLIKIIVDVSNKEATELLTKKLEEKQRQYDRQILGKDYEINTLKKELTNYNEKTEYIINTFKDIQKQHETAITDYTKDTYDAIKKTLIKLHVMPEELKAFTNAEAEYIRKGIKEDMDEYFKTVDKRLDEISAPQPITINKQLDETKAEIKDDIEATGKEVSSLTKTISVLSETIERLESKLNTQDNEYKQELITKYKEKYSEALKKLQEKYNKLKESESAMWKRNEELNLKVLRLEDLNDRAEYAKKETERDLFIEKGSNEKNKAEINSLKKQIAKAKDDYNKLLTSKRETEKLLNASTNKHYALLNYYKNAPGLNQTITEPPNSLRRSEIKKLNTQIEYYKKYIQNLNSKFINLRDAKNNLLYYDKSKLVEIRNLKKKITKQEAQIKELEKDNAQNVSEEITKKPSMIEELTVLPDVTAPTVVIPLKPGIIKNLIEITRSMKDHNTIKKTNAEFFLKDFKFFEGQIMRLELLSKQQIKTYLTYQRKLYQDALFKHVNQPDVTNDENIVPLYQTALRYNLLYNEFVAKEYSVTSGLSLLRPLGVAFLNADDLEKNIIIELAKYVMDENDAHKDFFSLKSVLSSINEKYPNNLFLKNIFNYKVENMKRYKSITEDILRGYLVSFHPSFFTKNMKDLPFYYPLKDYYLSYLKFDYIRKIEQYIKENYSEGNDSLIYEGQGYVSVFYDGSENFRKNAGITVIDKDEVFHILLYNHYYNFLNVPYSLDEKYNQRITFMLKIAEEHIHNTDYVTISNPFANPYVYSVLNSLSDVKKLVSNYLSPETNKLILDFENGPKYEYTLPINYKQLTVRIISELVDALNLDPRISYMYAKRLESFEQDYYWFMKITKFVVFLITHFKTLQSITKSVKEGYNIIKEADLQKMKKELGDFIYSTTLEKEMENFDETGVIFKDEKEAIAEQAKLIATQPIRQFYETYDKRPVLEKPYVPSLKKIPVGQLPTTILATSNIVEKYGNQVNVDEFGDHVYDELFKKREEKIKELLSKREWSGLDYIKELEKDNKALRDSLEKRIINTRRLLAAEN